MNRNPKYLRMAMELYPGFESERPEHITGLMDEFSDLPPGRQRFVQTHFQWLQLVAMGRLERQLVRQNRLLKAYLDDEDEVVIPEAEVPEATALNATEEVSK